MLEIYRHLENLATMAGLLDDMPELPRAQRMTQDLDELAPNYTGRSHIGYQGLSRLYSLPYTNLTVRR